MDAEESKQLDPQRLTAWYADHADRLKAFVFGLLRDWSLAEEAVQATFTKALTHGGNVQDGSEQAWLFQVAFNEAMALRRRRGVEGRSRERIEGNRRTTSEPDEDFLRWETVQQVQRALQGLPREQRTIVSRRIYDNQTFQEIAEELHLPLGTVLTRMRLALQKLQKALYPHQ